MPEPSPYAVALIMALLSAIVGAWAWVFVRLMLGLPVLPKGTPRIVPWGAGSVLVVMLAWVALNTAMPVVYFAAIRPRPAHPGGGAANARRDLSPGEMMALSAVQNAATLAVIPLLLAATSGARLRDFGVVAAGLDRQMGRGMLAYPLLAPIVFGAMGLSILVWPRTTHPLEEAIVQDRAPGMVAILVLAGVVFAPIAEELIFRGVLLGWLTRLAIGPKKSPDADSMAGGIGEILPADRVDPLLETVEIESPEEGPVPAPPETTEHAVPDYFAAPLAPIAFAPVAIEAAPNDSRSRALPLFAANVAVSLVFAALHGAVWPTPIPIFFLSLGLGFLYQRTGSILAPIALHMTFNGVSTLMMFLVLGANQAPKPDPKVADPIPPPALVAAWPEI